MAEPDRIVMERFLVVVIALLVLFFDGISCTPSASPTPTLTPTPTLASPKSQSAIPWDEAKNHIGERAIIYGAVVDAKWASGSKGQPTFLNIGKTYPDPNRFTVVIWIENRDKFSEAPEVYYSGKTIYVTGLITEYKGVVEIEVEDPSQIQER